MNFRTDLALERRDLYRKANDIKDEIPGIETEEEKREGITISRVKIINNEGAYAIGKPVGNYITIDINDLRIAGEDEIQKAAEALSEELNKLYNIHLDGKQDILVVGLGNMGVTPDALGPSVVKDIDITRHLLKYAPQYLEEGTRSVSAIAPGVLGTTGIETQEIIKGIVDNVNPKLLIVIDSLASKSIDRISSTIQIADTGIVPGAGVDNARKEISEKSLGIPVIALGIPTVVELATLITEGIDIFIDRLQKEAKSNNYLNKLQKEDKYEDVKEALNVGNYNMIVTPKEIDDLIENMSSVLARGINISL